MPERIMYSCPRCPRTFPKLEVLFMHLDRTNDLDHEITERFLVIDKSTGKLRVYTARAAPEELKEKAVEVTA